MAELRIDQFLVVLALKLVQPARTGDVVEGIKRLLPETLEGEIVNKRVKDQLDRLIAAKFVRIYADRRYELTEEGEEYAAQTGLRMKVDARRMFLLKETRRV